jgi:hypothetical protein
MITVSIFNRCMEAATFASLGLVPAGRREHDR